MLETLPMIPDTAALELEVLEQWERDGTFAAVRAGNSGGPILSLIDGPVTANKTLTVHTAWGRTLKDVFQRYKALRGFDQRYQNGFDCQGLWIEVGVERELGLNSKIEIEDYGLAEFARRCREKVIWSAAELTQGSKRLGQWMDWGNDYFTFSDTNIEYVWRFLKLQNEQGRLYKGHRSTDWCPRCGTSISQHELSQSGVYQDKTDPSLYVRFPLRDRPGEWLVVQTTAPWTLPANVAAAVKPGAEYVLKPSGEWVPRALEPNAAAQLTVLGEELVGLEYEGPYDHLPAVQGTEHCVVPWEDVTLEEGVGIVHIAPGCGAEDFELSRVHGLRVLTPIDESGRFYEGYGWLRGLGTAEAADQITRDLAERGHLVNATQIVHRYPHCWRCNTPLLFRITDDWFVAVDELRQPLLDANATVEWTPAYMGKRMNHWLRNMGDWNISRRRYYGLPLPIYECRCGRVTVVGSKAELSERAVSGLEQLEELRRPWIDEVPIRCEACGETVRRIPEVGDVWLDAGIVPFSTLGWQSPEWVEQGYATGAAKGLTTADLPDHAYWEEWFPADWVSEMSEQIRLWFYSQLFMSVALVGRAPFRKVRGYEKVLDEVGREMHSSWGNVIEAEDAFERMGADVMRWQYCSQPPDRNLLFGFGPAHEIQRKLLRHWHSVRFFIEYARAAGFAPDVSWIDAWPPADHPYDRWLVERTNQLIAEATDAYDESAFHCVIDLFDGFINDVSNWYIRHMRRRFWSGDECCLQALWFALVQSLRVIAPITPFRAEHLWRRLMPPGWKSIFLAGWPETQAVDAAVLKEMNQVRRVVDMGLKARARAGISLRQPLRRVVVDGAIRTQAYSADIAAALNAKEVRFTSMQGLGVRLKPNLRLLGPKLRSELAPIQVALATEDFERFADGRVRVKGLTLDPDEVLVERTGREGWEFAGDGFVTVGVDIRLDDPLRAEGDLKGLLRSIVIQRKAAGLGPEDRVHLGVPEERWLQFEEQIREAVKAESVRAGSALEIVLAASGPPDGGPE